MTKEYTAADLQILTDREHVRKRPAMYLGATDSNGLHQMAAAVIDFAFAEALAERATAVAVTINPDGSMTVEHNGHATEDGAPSRRA